MKLNRREAFKLFGGAATTGYLVMRGLPALASGKELQWKEGPSMMVPMQEIYPTTFQGEILVAGGFVPSTEPVFFGLAPTEKLYIYSAAQQSWRPGMDLPEARHHLGMLSNTKFIYAIGGFYGDKSSAWQVRNTVYRSTSADGNWLPAPSLPIPMAESAYGVLGENIHVIGGKTLQAGKRINSDTQDHYVLVQDKHWEKAAPATVARNSAASTVLNNKIYVVGGRRSGKGAENLRHMEVYDAAADKWEALRPLPTAVAGLTATALDGKLYVIGGEVFGPGGNWKTGKALNDVWSYNPETDMWHVEEKLLSPRHGHGSVVLNGRIHVIGGAAKVGPQDTSPSMIISAG